MPESFLPDRPTYLIGNDNSFANRSDFLGLATGALPTNLGGARQLFARQIDPMGAAGGFGIGGALFGNRDPKKVKGVIDPTTGTVKVGNYGKYNDDLSALYTQFLRTGEVPNQLRHGGGAYKKLKNQIRQLQATGWKWGTPTANGGQTVIPGQGPLNWNNPSMPGQGRLNWGAPAAPPPSGGMMYPGGSPTFNESAGGQSIQPSAPPTAQLNAQQVINILRGMR